ncbi:MAG: hybrid sensor histidine kinase/response regulator [Deltaproteobacteria bacterium]|nr:hybrid sensor histidine kinase/response regulator [Deltaproteobacteria bacterium]
MREEELLLRLREAFQVEAGERLSSIFANLDSYGKTAAGAAERKPLIEVLFREAHSLKGAARAVKLTPVESLCQVLETLFSQLKAHNPPPQPVLLDLLYGAAEMLEKLIADPALVTQESGRGEFSSLLARLLKVEENGLDNFLAVPESAAGTGPSEPQPDSENHVSSSPSLPAEAGTGALPAEAAEPSRSVVSPTPAAGAETLRVATRKVDELMLVAEEFISLKLALSQHLALLRKTLADFPVWEKQWGMVRGDVLQMRRSFSGSEKWSRIIGFLENNQQQVKQLERRLGELEGRVESDLRTQSGLVDELLDRVRDVAMLPIETLFMPMARMVRELARELGKKVDFEWQGGAIEVDRRVLDEMKDPLMHLLRNAVDHGLEVPQIRIAAGKDQSGRILCRAAQSDGSSIDITIEDDGHGIDTDKLKQKAVALSLVSRAAADAMSDESLLDMIFNSGFSTSPIITEISGRGLGMAIVREKIENLGGRIAVSTWAGAGTRFAVHLPVSVAVCRGIRVVVAGREFVFPSLKVERVLRAEKRRLLLVEGRMTVDNEGRVLPVIALTALLGLKAPVANPSRKQNEISLVIVGAGNRSLALMVDEVLGEQEILVKGLGRQLMRVPLIAGATILGSGKVVPIINVNDILESSLGQRPGHLFSAQETGASFPDGTASENEKVHQLLVVDDSITSRMLLQNILEAADYRVTTAVDGLAALSLLQKETFDLVVSDVEMPHMDGFLLTEKMRADERLAEIPVVLVTSLGDRQDRERGVAAGASAYIVKSEFDQNNLLDVVGRLL